MCQQNRVNKIYIFFAFIAIITPSYLPLAAQNLVIVKESRTFKEAVQIDSLQQMIELKSLIRNIEYDLRYATVNNFMHRKLYPQNKKTFMRVAAANALKGVQQELNKKGLGLKIFDAYRPYSVTKKMWDLIRNERYVADPSKGSGHNRGLAVDLTIIDLKSGEELDMGTGFDNFSDTAHQDFKQLTEEIIKNRVLLKEVMTQHGFSMLETEWWHFSWPNDRDYKVLDLSFKQLAKLTD
jgi:zinc D-Ala-D-Ala dipeptidase